MTRSNKLAQEARTYVESHPDSPEGIELYSWLWVPGDRSSLELPLPSRPASVMSMDANVSPSMPEFSFRIRQDHRIGWGGTWLRAGVGWNVEQRTAVLFFARGGKLEPSRRASVLSDTGMHAIADTGNEVRRRESAGRWLKLLDDLGLNEGEEWKRGI